MSTFNRFSDLPRELRDQIWSLAIRGDRPGVHIYGLCIDCNHGLVEAHAMVSCDWFSGTFTAPSWRRYFNNTDETSSDKNVSTYLIDGGMWTACKESRIIMEKHFRQSEWKRRFRDPPEEYSRQLTNREVFKMPSTGYFAGSPLHCLTTYAGRDLFVLQTDKLVDIEDWDFLGFDSALGGILHGFSGIKHVAIEYDPEWGVQMRKAVDFSEIDIVQTLKEAAFAAQTRTWKIWLIDHSLKRKPNAPVFEKKANSYDDINAFYASDRKFLEVEYDDNSSLENHWQYTRPAGDNSNNNWTSSTRFVRWLAEEIESNRYDYYTGVTQYPCEIGLLGWDEL